MAIVLLIQAKSNKLIIYNDKEQFKQQK